MQALKVIVIVMGVLIVGALALLGYGLSNGWHHSKPLDLTETSLEPSEVEAPAHKEMHSGENYSDSKYNHHKFSRHQIPEFENWKIDLPLGSEVVETSPMHGLLYLRYKKEKTKGGVIILDLRQQKQIGHIEY